MATPTQTRTILIKVDTSASKGLQDIANQMGLLNKSTKSLAQGFGLLTGAFQTWLGFLGIKQLADMSDQIQLLTGQLTLVTGSTQGASTALAGIAAVADRTNQAVSGTGQAFVRYAQILKPVNASTNEVLALVETLTNSLRTSRVPTDGITESLLTLSQAFIKGAVTGRELRTILTQNVTVANLLKQAYGGDIYKKAQDGVIGITDVMKILSANQEKINADAQALAPTFGQTLTKAFNDLTVSVGNLSAQYELSAKFAAIVGAVSENLGSILTVLGGIVAFLALTQVPAMIAAIEKLRIAMFALATSNPLLLALTAVATLGALVYENWAKLSPIFDSVRAKVLDFTADVESAFLALENKVASFLGTTLKPEAVTGMVNSIRDLKEEAQGLRDALAKPAQATKSPFADYQKDLDSLTEKSKNLGSPTKKLKDQLGDLNKQLLSGSITLGEYNGKLDKFDIYKLNREFSEGKYDVLKYNQTLEALRIENLNRGFAQGKLTIDQFNKGLAGANLAVLNEQLALGKISIDQYAASVIKLRDEFRPGAAFYSGISTFIEQAGTLSQGIAKVTTQAFDHLSDTLTSFIETGKLDFASFTKAILSDLTAMIVKAAIVAPIAQGILGAIGVGAVGAPSGAAATSGFSIASPGEFTFAKGGVMTSMGAMPLNTYASGGVASSPQVAVFGEGRKPEAYVPLPDGKRIPVNMQGGGGNGISIVQNITIASDGTTGGSDQSVGQNAKQLGDLVRKVTIDTIVAQKRKGGVLS